MALQYTDEAIAEFVQERDAIMQRSGQLSDRLVNDFGRRFKSMMTHVNSKLHVIGFQFVGMERNVGDEKPLPSLVIVGMFGGSLQPKDRSPPLEIVLDQKAEVFHIKALTRTVTYKADISIGDDVIEKTLVDHALACLRTRLPTSRK